MEEGGDGDAGGGCVADGAGMGALEGARVSGGGDGESGEDRNGRTGLTAILWRRRWRGRIWGGWRGRIACFGGRRWRSLESMIRSIYYPELGNYEGLIPSTTSRTA